MSINPYSPPQTDLSAPAAELENNPPLWNPNAAAMWSLLFSPVFGALVHMKNWQAMGEPEKAAASKRWAIGIVVALIALVVLELAFPTNRLFNAASSFGGFGLLIGWYMASGREQVQVVSMRFIGYPKRGWGQPLLYAVLAFIAFIVVMAICGFVYAMVMDVSGAGSDGSF
jgi:hypothetical protein